MKEVELHQAFSWTCDDCGRSNFASAVTLEDVDEAEKEAMLRDAIGLQPYEDIPDDFDGQFCLAPKTVLCPFCKTVFKTTGGGA